uniref:DUF6589 domain-containing protein n=1 Tax=Mycena chlorophos TaxID=658473 RepID=A0ABQ0LAP3_MYCCL|nr:predicted protein [Mycena chlorophos]
MNSKRLGFQVFTTDNPPTKRHRGPNKSRPPLAPTNENAPPVHAPAAPPPPPSDPKTQMLEDAIRGVKSAGFDTMYQFLDSLFGATDRQQKAATTRLVNEHGVEILNHLNERRPELVADWMAAANKKILEQEVKVLAENLRPNYGERVMDTLQAFAVDDLLADAERLAPTLWHALKAAGAMPDDLESVDSRKEYRVVLATILSMLCYSQNEKASSMRLTMSIFLLASSASRALFDVLHHAGICMSYTSTLEKTGQMGKERLQTILRIVETSVILIIWDNINIAFKVGQQRADAKDHFDNGTTASMLKAYGVKPGDLPLDLLPPQTTSTLDLKFNLREDYLPSPAMSAALQAAHLWHLTDILLVQYPTLRERFSASLTPPPTDFAIPVHKTEQFPLPAMHIDESTIDGTMQVLNQILKTLGLNSD